MNPHDVPASASIPLDRLRQGFLGVADATFGFQRQLQRRLREIDRKALNAQVLVKRHGKELAGYGVVAQSFREGAQQLQAAASEVQKAIHPLMLVSMQVLKDATQVRKLLLLPRSMSRHLPHLAATVDARRACQAEQSQRAGARLRSALDRFASVVAELEYVVVNGHIEAALQGGARAQLARVSADMESAVTQVSELLRHYLQHVEPILP